jgi:hypothetical protein
LRSLKGFESRQEGEDLRRVLLRVDLGEGVLDPAVRADDVRDAARGAVRRGIAGAVGQADRPLRVAQQGIGEGELRRERGVLLDRVERDPEDRRTLRFELRAQVAVPATFEGSSGGVGLRVEPQDDAAPAELVETPVLAVVILHVERGGLRPDRNHADLLKRLKG